MSQLYPQTYGGFRLCPDNKSRQEVDKTITRDKNVQATVQEIRSVATQKLLQKKSEYNFANNIDSEGFEELVRSEYLTVNHLAVLAQHYNRVIIVMNTDPTQCMTTVHFPKEGMSSRRA
jgi:hypothetical protein